MYEQITIPWIFWIIWDMLVGSLMPIKHVGAEQEKNYFCIYNYLYLFNFVYSVMFSWTRLIFPLSWSPRGHNWYQIILCVCVHVFDYGIYSSYHTVSIYRNFITVVCICAVNLFKKGYLLDLNVVAATNNIKEMFYFYFGLSGKQASIENPFTLRMTFYIFCTFPNLLCSRHSLVFNIFLKANLGQREF